MENALIVKTLASLAALDVGETSKLLIAVSGGPDSLALLHVLVQLRDAMVIGEVVAAHVNHSLRGEASDREQATVERYSTLWKVSLESTRADTQAIAEQARKGIEETARNIRYEFFEEIAAKHSCEIIITAHTANDQAETVIMNMVRGAGVKGLAGIPAKRTFTPLSLPRRGVGGEVLLIRPWLGVTREEIEAYIEAHNLRASHDESNQSLTYQRNRVRHGVIPALEAAYPDRSPITAIASLATRMRELSTFLDRMTEEKIEMLRENGGLSLAGLTNLNGFLLHAVIEAWINEILPMLSKNESVENYRLSSDEARRIEEFLASDAMAIELRRSVRLRKSGKVLRMSRAASS